jgi:HD-GYP domain-containing protein (c-di-GMP phosphodiesterase class II)
MRVCSLSSVKNRIVLGAPLPFGVRDSTHMLLLARGQVIVDEAQLQELFERGALVEVDELAGAVQPAAQESRARRSAALPAEWEKCGSDVRLALTAAPVDMAGAIDHSTDRLLALIAQAPDLALSQVVRKNESGSASGNYGVNHSIHAATACQAAARHLGWSAGEQRRAFQAALTMNISMIDLQARLATQVSPLTAKQRETINEHPTRSSELLGQAGIADEDWLVAVAQHHEVADGSGYPKGLKAVGELAELLRYADIYTARMSSRANRPAMSATQAGRELHQMAAESPLAAALIKSFGIFPPGSLVKLASGELGMVTRNGEKAHHPLVATLTDATGVPRLSPLMRDTARHGSAVVALISVQAMPMRLTDESIAELFGNA